MSIDGKGELLLSPVQAALLRKLAVKLHDVPSEDGAVHGLLALYVALETLEVARGQVAGILGDSSLAALDGLVDGLAERRALAPAAGLVGGQVPGAGVAQEVAYAVPG